ncbi:MULTISPECIES: DinB family protein [Shouchella]|uniref:DinB-like domain-containing protein n=2 Tax=Shouchella TaxID=2893057 RepID=Q5WAW1_SHOC1|nr:MULTISPECIES: DinB family protein [Shouchella]KKI86693.1 hypothetical protein WZ76_09700 [Shouchella clausii]MCM3380926.1 DinB family protein [Shouchella rhizosphaerae]PAD17688.1 DinB family protein [Shouchella clausii]PAE81598.1 DinB family protein [Shouchella clausii]BAD66499.1 hypothetical protein ABC3968 [Shouchella clausii KSM-K16]
MKSSYMEKHFHTLYKQRHEMSMAMEPFKGEEWKRPCEDKWSFGETFYHLFLMVKRFKQLNKLYLPLSKPIAAIRKNKPYETHSKDVYKQYHKKHHKPMKAPSMLIPPKEIQKNTSFAQLVTSLDAETKQLQNMVDQIKDEIAGHIRYPDPIADYPNLIQSIHLLGIHENHHFQLCKEYYKLV